ncbi:quinol:electron acceptor oxidoreductase subunit ActD [Bryobacter aggregatus]|uniref:quinol:electron acceptor oxidoreductase subunit ActD n=1 Tax=Bryobacter aggregatus TaxID=360054 RepID=UPI0004E16474|nr:quinol:electron acceptor oxidoreductase subunit ActD [Bryobacter aggregatus]
MSKNTSVYGIFHTRVGVENAIDQLRAHGFRSADISVLMPENVGNKDIGTEKTSKAPEAAAAAGATGAVAGGVLGWLVGIGALAIPGVGPFIAAGPIMAALAGVGAGAAVGGLGGALIGAGIPEYEVKRYEGRVKEGGILMSIHCDNAEWVTRAIDLLKKMGAVDIASSGEAGADYAQTERPILTGPQV